MSSSNKFYTQPWFLICALGTLLLLALYFPQSSMPSNPGINTRPYSHEDMREMVKSELREQLLSTVQSKGSEGKQYPPVKTLSDSKRLRIAVTGGAGFVGSHLVDRLMMAGHQVTVIDNMFTGRTKNVAQWLGHPNFQLIIHDVIEPIMLEVDQIYHLACPASPPHYQYNPIKTIKTSTEGTLNMLGLAKRVEARMLLTSTSEVYGDPEVHPQKETYWGHVNPIGPRACYDEGKRVAETMMYAYESQVGVEVRVARIFNTFGPRMHPNDGRVVSNFIIQALQNKDITIYGSGKQTRSFQYVDDLVEGLIRLMNGNYSQPVNLGNPEEYTVKDFAVLIKQITNSNSTIKMLPATKDDPRQRRPDITTAKEQIGWEPRVHVSEGLKKTIEYFARELAESGEIIPTGPDASKPQKKRASLNALRHSIIDIPSHSMSSDSTSLKPPADTVLDADKAADSPAAVAPSNSSGNAANQSLASFQTASHHPSVSQDTSVGLKQELTREEIIHTIFGDVGDLVNDFSCAVESTVLLHGRMYVTNRFLCFYSNLFGLEKKIRVPYSHISLITKENTAMVIPNAIAVTTHRKEYLFRSFWDRDECFRLLQEMISRNRTGEPSSSSAETNSSSTLNHAPSFDTLSEASAPTSKPAAVRPISLKPATPSTVSAPPRPASIAGIPITSPTNGVEESKGTDARGHRSGSTEEECDIETVDSRSATGSDKSKDAATLFQEELSTCKLKNVVATPEPLPVSLKEFMSLFIDEGAVHSYRSYHESVGDIKLEVSTWHEMKSLQSYGREMKFVKPIPSIKSSTRAVKVQRYRKYGDIGLIIWSSTRLEDVPAADSFSVEDVIAIKAIAEDKVSVELTFEVKFIKSTMFRYVIESNTNSEMAKWLESFYNRLKQVTNKRSGEESLRVRTPSDAPPNERQPTTSRHSHHPSSQHTHKPSAQPATLVEGIIEKVKESGGMVYWSSWLILTLTFLFFGYQSLLVSDRLHSIESKLFKIQMALDALAKKV